TPTAARTSASVGAIAETVDDLVTPLVGAQEPVPLGRQLEVRVRLGPLADEVRFLEHLDHGHVLPLEPQASCLLAVDELPLLLDEPEPPGLDPLGEHRVVPRVLEPDPVH